MMSSCPKLDSRLRGNDHISLILSPDSSLQRYDEKTLEAELNYL